MKTSASRISLAVLLAALLYVPACSSDNAPARVVEFLLPDINPDSPTYDSDIGPRDQIGFTCAWYFGAAT